MRPEQLAAETVELSVSQFVSLVNHSFDMVFQNVVITGELANFRVSKGKWVYFDLKDEESSIKCFGSVYQLPGPLEDGMMLQVSGQPRLHNLYGFSFNFAVIRPAGEGTIKRAAQLLQAKLQKEGLFDDSRKRPLPYPPRRIGLVTSRQSAAYADFIKIIVDRWRGLNIDVIDVQVQGEVAPVQIISAIEQFNAESAPPEVLVLIRGGGSPEDLAAFSTEQVTRAVAASRIPTMVAIGHESDISLAELAADKRASTPSNAAELLVPDRAHLKKSLPAYVSQLNQSLKSHIRHSRRNLQEDVESLDSSIRELLKSRRQDLARQAHLVEALSPQAILRRGYAIVRRNRKVIRQAEALKAGDIVEVEFSDGQKRAVIG